MHAYRERQTHMSVEFLIWWRKMFWSASMQEQWDNKSSLVPMTCSKHGLQYKYFLSVNNSRKWRYFFFFRNCLSATHVQMSQGGPEINEKCQERTWRFFSTGLFWKGLQLSKYSCLVQELISRFVFVFSSSCWPPWVDGRRHHSHLGIRKTIERLCTKQMAAPKQNTNFLNVNFLKSFKKLVLSG